MTPESGPPRRAPTHWRRKKTVRGGARALGFLNPFLYAHADALQDVTSGCNNNGYKYGGFTAVKGFDPASGLGTPDFEALKKAALALP